MFREEKKYKHKVNRISLQFINYISTYLKSVYLTFEVIDNGSHFLNCFHNNARIKKKKLKLFLEFGSSGSTQIKIQC